MNNKKGITLVALVVTIAVMLILAGVSLNLILDNKNPINKAQNTMQKLNEETQNTLTGINDYYSKYTGEKTVITLSSSKGGEILSNTNNVIVKDDNKNNVVVPAGFKIASDSATIVDLGVVIQDATGNQFVWVPVADASSLYVNGADILLSGSTGVKTGIYSKSEILIGKTRTTPGTTNYREPDLVVGTGTGYDADTTNKYYLQAGFTNTTAMATAIVLDYAKNIESIKKYGGFYLGRYELTGSVTNPTEKEGIPLVSQNWYNLYKACRNITGENNSAVQSTMIWGFEWDVTCNFIANYGEKKSIIDSSNWGNYTNNTETGHGSKQNTGANQTWRANNIYDLAGNCYEWTQENLSTDDRSCRGGFFENTGANVPASDRGGNNITTTNNTVSSRAILYIK